jgi:DNA (cytosine-5)-methyltransferase 1
MVHGTRPRFFVFENVRGILSAAIRHRPLHLRGPKAEPLDDEEELGSALKKVILPTLRDELEYEVVYGLVNAADYGVPQKRDRVLFFGSRDRELGSDRWPFFETAIERLMPATHSRDGTNGRPEWKTLGDALQGLRDDNPEFIPYSDARRRVLELVPPGKNWRFLRDNYGHEYLKEIMGGAYLAEGGKVGFWRRLDLAKPSPTVPASPIQKGTCLCHPLHTRPLSVREYARVQQFPDSYEFVGSTSSKYRQIGNAVPVGLGQAIGEVFVNVMRGQVRIAEEYATYAPAAGGS